MLEKNIIPDTEPIIRVGIVLPEDKFNEIVINIPQNLPFVASTEHGEQVSHARELVFTLSQGTILLNSTISGNTWVLKTSQAHEIQTQSGFIVKNVIAGRGFHWQKLIDVYLPGSIEIIHRDTYLILINELPLEHYLMCVATSEMGAKCPKALIEAQTIVARSWMLANVEQKHIDLGMDVCNDDCCQRYQGSGNLTEHSIAGALTTRGQVLIYKDKICDARYSKSCGGIMESFATIWDGDELDYLQNLPDLDGDEAGSLPQIRDEKYVVSWIDNNPGAFCSPATVSEESLSQYLANVDEDGKYYRWHVAYSQEELCRLLNDRLNINAEYISGLIALSRGGSGRIIDLQIEYKDINGKISSIIINRDVAIRKALHNGFLYSSCIYFEQKTDKNGKITNIIIHGAGWGHGVGLCQIGALGMSLKGYSSTQIVSHYYPGSKLVKVYP